MAVLLSVFSSQMQAISQGLCVPVIALCRNLCLGVDLAYQALIGAEMGVARCGRGFRAVALCLAKIEPFYWPARLLQY